MPPPTTTRSKRSLSKAARASARGITPRRLFGAAAWGERPDSAPAEVTVDLDLEFTGTVHAHDARRGLQRVRQLAAEALPRDAAFLGRAVRPDLLVGRGPPLGVGAGV